MKKFFVIQFKRVIKILPFIFIVSIILTAGLGVIFGGMVLNDENDERNAKIRVGLVGDVNSTYLGMGIKVFAEFDSTQYTMEFVELTEEEAKNQLAQGKLSIFIVVPDNFIEQASHGNIMTLNYYASPLDQGLVMVFKDDITKVISEMLVASQKGIYGTEKAMKDNGIYKGVQNRMDSLSLEYVGFILDRTEFYKTDVVGVADGLRFKSYMFCGLAIFFLMLFGISCAPIFVKRDMSFSRVMAAKGRGAFKQVAGEYLAYTSLIMIIAYIIMAAIGLFGAGSLVPEMEKMTLLDIAVLWVQLIPVIGAITAFQFLIFEVCTNTISGVLVQFTLAVALSYVGGCIYPIYFFPQSIQNLSAFLPTGIARGFLSSCILKNANILSLLGLILYIALFFLLTVWVRNRRIKSKRGD